jgi:acyl-CoA reductase-like NAD-dependent aldehyde dehydrogenase
MNHSLRRHLLQTNTTTPLSFTIRSLSSSSSTPTPIKLDNPFKPTTDITEISTLSLAELEAIGKKNRSAQKEWVNVPLEKRISIVKNAVVKLTQGPNSMELAETISKQMGKPFKYAKGELGGTKTRADAMCELAPTLLSDRPAPGPAQAGFQRRLTLEPVGQVLTLSPWNYPLLTAINSVVPAVLAGNGVLLSHGLRTPGVSKYFQKAFEEAGVPSGLVASIIVQHPVLHEGILSRNIGDHVVFTGSVSGGHAVNKTLGSVASRFVTATFELGGNDAAYVAEDANVAYAAECIVDGAMFNAGQSCCGIQRVYVHQSRADEFREAAKKHVMNDYVLGDPFHEKTNMGPMAQPGAPQALAEIVKNATSLGARIVATATNPFTTSNPGSRFFAPTYLDNCTPKMRVMQEEVFGPIMASATVKDDKEAFQLMNNSSFGLTAAVFTQSSALAERAGKEISAGTVFMNRCDYLDPYLVFNGRRDSGNGAALGEWGFLQFVRPKSLHFKIKI